MLAGLLMLSMLVCWLCWLSGYVGCAGWLWWLVGLYMLHMPSGSAGYNGDMLAGSYGYTDYAGCPRLLCYLCCSSMV